MDQINMILRTNSLLYNLILSLFLYSSQIIGHKQHKFNEPFILLKLFLVTIFCVENHNYDITILL